MASFLPKDPEDLQRYILGDEDLMWYFFDMAAKESIAKGDEACRELLEHLNADCLEALHDCGDNPKANVTELAFLLLPEWMDADRGDARPPPTSDGMSPRSDLRGPRRHHPRAVRGIL
jgi:hypothetical protein